MSFESLIPHYLLKSEVGVNQTSKDDAVKQNKKPVLFQEEGVDVMNRETAHER